MTRTDDSSRSHAADTIHAGAGLCDKDSVRLMEASPPRLKQLIVITGCCMCKTAPAMSSWMCFESVPSNDQVFCTAEEFGSASFGSSMDDAVAFRWWMVPGCSGFVHALWCWQPEAAATCTPTQPILLRLQAKAWHWPGALERRDEALWRISLGPISLRAIKSAELCSSACGSNIRTTSDWTGLRSPESRPSVDSQPSWNDAGNTI